MRCVARCCLALLLSVLATSAYSASKTILMLGDSLTAEYGLARGSGWAALLEQRLQARQIDAAVVNASISGDTTSGGLTRLPALLARVRPQVLIIELGGNDALRGLSLAATEANLAAMIEAGKAKQAKVLLVGMQIPPNYGKEYAQQFSALYARLAQRHKVALVPFLLAGLEQRQDLFQQDRIHPTAAAQPILFDNVWPHLQPLLRN